MQGSSLRLVLLAGFLAASAVFLWWGHLPGRARRALALMASAAGLVFLILALQTAGHRESETTGSFILGGAYVAGQASASASLPYYVMTAVCLLLGTAGLAVPDPLARRLSQHWMAAAVVLSMLATTVRFALEKAAAPWAWTWAVGVTWLAPLVGAFFAVRLRAQGRGLRALARALLLYGLAARGWVAAFYVAATAFSLGSHFDLSAAWVQLRDPVAGTVRTFAPGSAAQLLYVVLVPQVLVWPLYTLLAGLVGAAVAYLLAAGWRPRRLEALPVEMAPAPQDR